MGRFTFASVAAAASCVMMAQAPSAAQAPLEPTVLSGDVPFYPADPLLAHISGNIRARVSIEGGRVSSVDSLAGPAVLIPAVKANLSTWRFADLGGAVFSTEFQFTAIPNDCDHGVAPTAMLKLPHYVEIRAGTLIHCEWLGPGDAPQRQGLIDVRGPTVTGAALPTYPRSARALGHEGDVQLIVVHGGAEVVIEKGLPDLAAAALANVQTWSYAAPAIAFNTVFRFRLAGRRCQPDQTPTITIHFPGEVQIEAPSLVGCSTGGEMVRGAVGLAFGPARFPVG